MSRGLNSEGQPFRKAAPKKLTNAASKAMALIAEQGVSDIFASPSHENFGAGAGDDITQVTFLSQVAPGYVWKATVVTLSRHYELSFPGEVLKSVSARQKENRAIDTTDLYEDEVKRIAELHRLSPPLFAPKGKVLSRKKTFGSVLFLANESLTAQAIEGCIRRFWESGETGFEDDPTADYPRPLVDHILSF